MKERVKTAGFPGILKKYEIPGVVSIQAIGGNLASFNFKSGFHKDHHKLDGETYDKEIGASKTTPGNAQRILSIYGLGFSSWNPHKGRTDGVGT